MKQLFSVIVLIVLSAFAAGANLAAPLLTDLDVEYSYDRNGRGQKLGNSVYVGPKQRVPTRPGLFLSPIRDTGSTFIPVDIVDIGGTTVSTDYFGAYEYVDGKFARLNTATDGNTVLEQASYYPYGMSMSESFQMDRENHKIGNRIDEAEALKNFNK